MSHKFPVETFWKKSIVLKTFVRELNKRKFFLNKICRKSLQDKLNDRKDYETLCNNFTWYVYEAKNDCLKGKETTKINFSVTKKRK